ncbi:hypothetical protein [Curtobacterium sp. ME12]|uniref:hypothetical protein n=1 Tax=Curtobacterium sp. ME12 TaxID=2744253 RepID=UPI0015F67FA0|nr:hypothetical protein [Curtobacterium sp. ME12]
MTATMITPTTGAPVAGFRHVAAYPSTSRSSFSEVREAHRNRVLAASAILTGIGAVSISAVAAIVLSVAA